MKFTKYLWISMVLAGMLLTGGLSSVCVAQLPPGIPREETLIFDQLTGRVAMPHNFNEDYLWSGSRPSNLQ
jgi:hypothetical protein